MGEILLVDESAIILAALTDSIKDKLGYDVDPVLDIDTAVEKVKTKKYDLIISEDYFPVGKTYSSAETNGGRNTGQRFWKDIRSNPEFKLNEDTPILACVAGSGNFSTEKYLAAGANRVLSKPYSLKETMGVVSNLLKDK